MGWTTPTTRSTGLLVTAAIWNTDLVDDLKYLKGQAGTVAFESAITVDQGADDGFIFVAISSDVGHGITDQVRTDAYFAVGKGSATAGAARLLGFSEGATGINVESFATNDTTTKSTDANAATAYLSLIARKKSGTNYGNLGANANIVNIRNNDISLFIFDADGDIWQAQGIHFIGDDTNTNMTVGLTINQGAADDEAIALKSSDVAHGITTLTETDTFATFRKTAADSGGLRIDGYTEANIGVTVVGRIVSEDTSKGTGSRAGVEIALETKSGTTVALPGANANILAVQAGVGVTRFILDTDGDSHQDVGTAWTNYSAHDDVGLLTALSVLVSKPTDPIRGMFGEFLDEHRQELQALSLVTFNDDGHHFVNMSKLLMLTVGAAIQNARRVALLEGELAGIRGLLSGA